MRTASSVTASSGDVIGIRAAAAKVLARRPAGTTADVGCLQETRIDHHVATPGLAGRAGSAVVERAPSHGERWSDHAPVTVVHGS